MPDEEYITTDDGRLIHKSELAGLVIICQPTFVSRKVEKVHCPNCNKDQAFLVEHLAWYGEDITCLVCGDRWMDGELCPRPLRRGWRRQSVLRALDRINAPVDLETANEMIKLEKQAHLRDGGGPEIPQNNAKTV